MFVVFSVLFALESIQTYIVYLYVRYKHNLNVFVAVRMRELVFLCLVGSILAAHHHHTTIPTTTLDPNSDEARMLRLEGGIENLARQLMMQQLFVEERIRSDGDSGIESLKNKYIYHFSTTRLAFSLFEVRIKQFTANISIHFLFHLLVNFILSAHRYQTGSTES